ncbi:MAG TPA: hypothetical protein PKW90_29980, partial [Myxococcota bacterium]|nr:hypothetical protein [Myxococcota bacterium]
RLHANGHDERFVVGREDLGISTAHLLPVIAALATSVLKLPAPVERKQREKLERDLELARQQSQALRERQKVAEKESAALRTRLAELERGIRQTPGLPAYRWESLKGWLETLETLERPASRPGGTRRYTAEQVSGHWRALPEWMVAAAGTGEIRSLEAALARAPEEVQAPLRSAIQRARRRCAAPGAELLLERIGNAMRRAAPEVGVPLGYVEGFLRRNRPGMLGALQRGFGA